MKIGIELDETRELTARSRLTFTLSDTYILRNNVNFLESNAYYYVILNHIMWLVYLNYLAGYFQTTITNQTYKQQNN